ncbi:MAG TPA: hypothetical protein VMI34_04685 [Candidatus Bathyarchaeia archaeon]|nr:hypothetical protein [Candidatus Bathyarchaeia archaeon]
MPRAAWLLWRAFAVHHLGSGVVAALAALGVTRPGVPPLLRAPAAE